MNIQFSENILNFLKKNFILCALGIFVLGGGVVYFVMEKKIHSGYALEVLTEDSGGNKSSGGGQGDQTNGKVSVDISGAVLKPGVYEVENGSRVGDLLALAGGANGDASATWVSRNLNLSKKLEDSSKIYIPFEWEFYFPEEYTISKTVNKNYASSTDFDNTDPVEKSKNTTTSSDKKSSSKTTTSTSDNISDGGNSDTASKSGVGDDGQINVNTASSSELDTLPGIGSAYAEKIITNRPYKDFAEFESKSGLYKSTIENIKLLIIF